MAAPQRTFNEQAVADFYRGKTLTLLAGTTAGGGYDNYTRFLARTIGKYIPGNPNVIVQNMPGGGGMVAANNLFNASAKDGTVVGMITRGVPAEELMGREGPQFKSTEFQWVGSMNNEVSICISRSDAPVKTFQDVLTTPLTVGGTGPGADTDFFPMFLNAVIGTKFDIKTGYPGGNDINLAIERGEVQGRCGFSYSSYISTRRDWIEQKFVNIMVQLALQKHPDMPDVPLVTDFAKNSEERQLMRIVFSRQAMGRPLALPPGVPADRVAAIRTAFDKTVSDPQVVAEAKQAKLELNPVSGEEVQDIVKEIFQTPPDLVKRLDQLTKPS